MVKSINFTNFVHRIKPSNVANIYLKKITSDSFNRVNLLKNQFLSDICGKNIHETPFHELVHNLCMDVYNEAQDCAQEFRSSVVNNTFLSRQQKRGEEFKQFIEDLDSVSYECRLWLRKLDHKFRYPLDKNGKRKN